MYARVTTAYVQPGKGDELTQYTRDTIVPIAQQQKGFKVFLGLIDRSSNKGFSITLWETEADMLASEASGGYYQEQLAKVAPLFASAPVREAYEVGVHAIEQGRTPIYARVLIAEGQPGKMDELIDLVRNSVLPVARQQQGFKGLLLLADRARRKGISIGLWETEADLKASETSGYFQEQVAKFAHIYTAPPVREIYEVTVHG